MIEQFLIRDSVLGSVTNLKISAGTLSSNRSDVTFANSNGISFGLNTNGVITASGGGGGGGGSLNISAGTTSSSVSAVTFSNANGVSFGFDGSNVTATVATNYQSQGAYLTTAALSQDSSKYAGTGFTTATTAGTNVVGTLATNGLSMGVPAYLTTAMASNAATISNINVSAGTTSNNLSAITFSNSNNVSFGLNGSTLTGSIATTYAGTGITTTTTAGTAVVGTLNTSGLSLGIPAYLTTAAQSGGTSNFAGTGFTSTSTAGSNIVGTLGTNGLSVGVPNYLTTAMASNAATISNINVSAGTTSTNASAFTFSNLNNVTFGLGTGASAGVITASIPSQSAAQINVSAGTTSTNASAFTFSNANNVSFGLGTGASAGNITASIATTYAGTGFTTATTAGTAIVGTLNTSGLSMGVPAFLTTAMQSNAATISNINISAGTTSTNASAFTFSNVNNVSFGLGTGASAGNITGSIATTYAGTGFTTATTAGTAIVGTLNTSGLSMGVPAYLTTADLSQNSSNYAGINSAITGGSMTVNTSGISVNIPIATLSLFENIPAFQGTTMVGQGVSRIDVTQMILPQCLSAGYFRYFGSMSQVSTTIAATSANTSWSANATLSVAMAIFTQGTGANSLSLRYSTSSLATWVFQTSVTAGNTGSQYTVSFNITYPIQGTTSLFQTNYATTLTQYAISTGSLTGFTGAKFFDIPFAQSLSPGNYWIGLGTSTNTASPGGPAGIGNGSVIVSCVMLTQATTVYGLPGVGSNVTNQFVPGVGSWSTNSAVMSTSSMGLANISFRTADNAKMPFQFIREA